MARPGWAEIPAVAGGQVYEVKSALILQPGPAALTDGVEGGGEVECGRAWVDRRISRIVFVDRRRQGCCVAGGPCRGPPSRSPRYSGIVTFH